jgi:hypothetical protein
MTTLLTAPAGVDVEAWANEVIRQARADIGGLLPSYGSEEWSHAAAATRWASAVAAAEARRRENTHEAIAEQLARDLWLERLKLLEDEHYAAEAAAWKQHWRWLTDRHQRRGCGPEAGQIALAWARTTETPGAAA